jgi:hypothetical protein
MTVDSRRLSLALHPLVAEAKRRMRRRRSLVAAFLVLLAGGAVGGWFGLHSAAMPTPAPQFVATQSVRSAFASGGSSESGGRPAWGLDRFDELRFIPSAPFHIGIVLTNEASQSVTLTNVRAVFPHRSVIRQLGTALAAFDPPACTTPSCPGPGGGISQPGNFGALRPTALRIAPGNAAAVQLNFRFLGCPQARRGSLRNVSRIEVSYRDPAGAVIRQRVGLGTSTLVINTPHVCSGS